MEKKWMKIELRHKRNVSDEDSLKMHRSASNEATLVSEWLQLELEPNLGQFGEMVECSFMN